MSYKYALLDPLPQEKEANEKIFASGPVFGIKVTDPKLAVKCVANLDSQYTDGRVYRAAIDQALTCNLPNKGTMLVTIHHGDLDSVGAMAILEIRRKNRRKGRGISWDTIMRAGWIAQRDKLARGGWPGPKPLPTIENPWSEDEYRLAAIVAFIMDHRVFIYEKVAMMERWLVSGEDPSIYRDYRDMVDMERVELMAALVNGLVQYRTETTDVFGSQNLAVVVSSYPAAIAIGYYLAPVVVAMNSSFRFQEGEPSVKFIICQYEAGWVNLRAVLAELQALEPGWGESSTSIGFSLSLRGVDSKLSLEEVMEIVKKYFLK
ncbi:MAG: hypothetical protein HY602_03135 [Parcubacteria group bacterium]|nr:hypothetical protein [Parcubacteria group bacterium]